MEIYKDFDGKGVQGMLLIYPDISTAVKTGKKNRFGHEIVECKDTIVSFRIYEYDENGKHKVDENGHTIFKDYKILHHDLLIRLLEGHFYETDKGNFIDYPGLHRYERETGDSNSP